MWEAYLIWSWQLQTSRNVPQSPTRSFCLEWRNHHNSRNWRIYLHLFRILRDWRRDERRSNSPKLAPSVRECDCNRKHFYRWRKLWKSIYRRVSRFEKGDEIWLPATREDGQNVRIKSAKWMFHHSLPLWCSSEWFGAQTAVKAVYASNLRPSRALIWDHKTVSTLPRL